MKRALSIAHCLTALVAVAASAAGEGFDRAEPSDIPKHDGGRRNHFIHCARHKIHRRGGLGRHHQHEHGAQGGCAQPCCPTARS